MKKKLLSSLIAGSLCLALCIPGTAYADGQKVVTIGADLTQDQKTAVLKYFGVLGQNIETLTITNQDERDHLASYVPMEQIGTRTFSCALVNPTTSGGIHVKTANLSWVTSNMIATTLSTSGVVNCDVLAAAPFEVSGTGALTGIIMAYESATGTALDPVKKDLATQELITTGTIANQVGQTQATNIVNQIKIQVIQGEVVEPEEVEEIVEEVVEVVEEENPEVELSDEDRALLTGLMKQIAEQKYDYEEVKDTLQRVEDNMNGLNEKLDQLQTPNETESETSQGILDWIFGGGDDTPEETEPETLDPDSILMNTDDSALGENVNIDATNDEAVQEETQPYTEEVVVDEGGFDITSSDSYTDENAGSDDGQGEWVPDEETITTEAAAIPGETTQEVPFTEAPAEEMPAADAPIEEVPAADDGYVDIMGGETAETQAVTENALDLGQRLIIPDTTSESQVNAGISQAKLLIENQNVIPVSGYFSIMDSDGNICSNVDLAGSQTAVVPVTQKDAEAAAVYGWTPGTALLFNTDYQLQPSQGYFFSFEGLVADASNPEGTAAVSIIQPFVVRSYGVGLDIANVRDAYAGAVLSGNVYMDETMAYAAVGSYDASMISFDTVEFSPEAVSFNVTCLQAGTTAFTVDFYDAEGNYIASAEYVMNILS